MLAFFGVPQDDKISVLILKLKTPPYKPRFPHVYTMFREGGTHPQEHRREDAMVVASGDVGRYARKISCALCAARGHACGTERRRRAPCTLFSVRDGRVQSCANWSNFLGSGKPGGRGSVPLRYGFCASQKPSTRSLSSKLSVLFPSLSNLLKYNSVRECSKAGRLTSPRVILTVSNRSRDWIR